ncbi:GlsB/YeaQ/YmgE family stress response membrane protein [Thiohalomonas denitrificans]|uniref:GlsB/YeaQ/YmgE family stress response membrane protein n=1 Tax=Thiohalomonas denitrificans TaxID=415747 RepID=UPI0026EA7871|nr:GlsB/YeaQ/YmgE family stress response membrane protein [Thiohalomonas denitrificans]
MGFIGWIIFGLIAGVIAKMLMPGRDPGGFFVTILIGILGAVVGGFIGSALGLGTVDSFSLGSFALAVLGAVLLLWGYRAVRS